MPLLLELPLELRNQIYAIIATPTEAPFFEYKGLYLSCHQIKEEMDSECPKAFEEHLIQVHEYYGAKNSTLLTLDTNFPMHLAPSLRIGVCCIEMINVPELWQTGWSHFSWFGLTSKTVNHSVANLYLDVLRISITIKDAWELDWHLLFRSIRRFRLWNTPKSKKQCLIDPLEPRPRSTEIYVRISTEKLTPMYLQRYVGVSHVVYGDGWDLTVDYRENEPYSTIVLHKDKDY
jgi:hypothetical protein